KLEVMHKQLPGVGVDTILFEQYRVVKKIGCGSFGHIFASVRQDNGEPVALKIEPKRARHQQLQHEYHIYRFLSPGLGVPRVYAYVEHADYNVMVMELLGPSLEEMFHICSRRFSLKTVLMLAMQMIERLEYVHKKCFVHRDVKPDNFVMSGDDEPDKLYIIDFGLAKRYIEGGKNEHIPFAWSNHMTGTARYASVNAQRGFELSRRDDMMSLGYVWMYFLRGSLPWQGMPGPRAQRHERIVEMKQSLRMDELCRGFPDEFAKYLVYCQTLTFGQQPNYFSIRRSLSNLFIRLQYVSDSAFDWCRIK
ncbi:hypothetical protein KR093_011365, partial [Drosophila rubida]